MANFKKSSFFAATLVLGSLFTLPNDAQAQLFGAPAAPAAATAVERRAAPQRRRLVRRPPIAVEQPVEKPIQSTLRFDSTLGELIDAVRKKSQTVIELAKKENDHLIFKIGADLELFISNWEKNHAENLSQDAKGSNAEIQRFLSSADALMTNILAKGPAGLTPSIDDFLAKHDDLTTNKPTVKHLPQVYSYGPYLIQPLTQKRVIVTIKTLSFSYGSPILHFNGAAITPLSDTGGVWTFEVDTSALKGQVTEVDLMKAELEVVRPKPNSTDTENYKLPLNFMIMPSKIGTYVLNYTTLETMPRSEIKSVAFNHMSKAVENECKDFTQGVASQGRIVKNVSEIYANGEQGSSQLAKVTTTDFVVKLCAKRQNRPLQGFPQGNQNSIWQWEEHWSDYTEKLAVVEGAFPTLPEEIKLETHTTKLQRFNLLLKGNDGREYSFNGSAEKGLFAVKFNPASKTIVVHTKTHEPRLN